MPQDAREVTMALFPETTFGTGPTNWDSDGAVVEFLAVDPQRSGLKSSVVENRNSRRRAWATRSALHGLRSEATASMAMYLTGSGATTANDAQAASFSLPNLLTNALGGLFQGYASAVVTPSASAPDITIGQGTNHPAGGFIFGMNTSASAGQFACVNDVSTDVLNLRTNTDNVINTVGAAIACYPHTRALGNRDHASHITHALYFRGEDTDDVYEGRGCKINVTGLEGGEAGSDATVTMEIMAATFNSEDETRYDLTGTPEGPAPPIVGRSGTAVRIANVGTAAMTDAGAYSFAFSPGIVHNKVMGVSSSAVEGVLGYHGGGYDDTILEVMVPYDDAWITDFRNSQLKHVMIQVGDQRGDAWGIYLPRCQIYEDPEQGVSADETSIKLVLRALEFAGTTHTEGTDNYELERAKFAFLIAA